MRSDFDKKQYCTQPTAPMLVHEITRLFDERMRRTTTEPLQTQNSCRMILRNLSRMEGYTQLDLVRLTHLKPPTVSVTLKKLEDSGFVRRETDANDQRAIRVYLTEKGRELNASTLARLKECDAILTEGVSEAEQAFLLQVLTKMRDNMLRKIESEQRADHETD